MSVLGELLLLVLPLIQWVVLVWDCMFGWIYNLVSDQAKRKERYSQVNIVCSSIRITFSMTSCPAGYSASQNRPDTGN